MAQPLAVHDGICTFAPAGEFSLLSIVDAINQAIRYCREAGLPRLLVDATRVTGVAVPTLVDRFLAVEDWAESARGLVAVALVIRPEFIHPQRFGVKFAHHLGLLAEVSEHRDDALAWLATVEIQSA
ncbi:MAG: hypothetical protein JSR18_10410 [Proteobacteria bacterium]|nr:hypothetical protein [Pseudomonadota bacterium]